jgi:hypothetical protein
LIVAPDNVRGGNLTPSGLQWQSPCQILTFSLKDEIGVLLRHHKSAQMVVVASIFFEMLGLSLVLTLSCAVVKIHVQTSNWKKTPLFHTKNQTSNNSSNRNNNITNSKRHNNAKWAYVFLISGCNLLASLTYPN